MIDSDYLQLNSEILCQWIDSLSLQKEWAKAQHFRELDALDLNS